MVHSIELTARLRAGIVVVHSGFVSADIRLEIRLREPVEAGKSGGADFRAIQAEMIAERASQSEGRIAAVKESLRELLPSMQRLGVGLGIENRYHFDDIPSIDEMGELLSLAPPEQIGMIFDIGHAHTLDRLGFFLLENWLERFTSQIIGTHLHDVRGVMDHFVPGLGDMNYERIAAYLPDEAIRIVEVQSWNTTEQLRQG